MSNQSYAGDFVTAVRTAEQISDIQEPLSAVECEFFQDEETGGGWPEVFLLRFGGTTVRIEVDDDTCEIKLNFLPSSQSKPGTPVSHQPPWNRLIGTKTSWCWCMFNNMWCRDGVEIEFETGEGCARRNEIIRFVGLPAEIQVSAVTPFSRHSLMPDSPSPHE